MSKASTPKVTFWIIPFTFIAGILIAILFFYSSKPCKAPAHGGHQNTHAAATSTENSTDDKAGEYITITGPDGIAVKVSSKFSNLVDYMTDEDVNTGNYANTASADEKIWKNKFREWRNKMSNTNVTPSLTNFMDIIELSKVLNEN